MDYKVRFFSEVLNPLGSLHYETRIKNASKSFGFENPTDFLFKHPIGAYYDRRSLVLSGKDILLCGTFLGIIGEGISKLF